MAHSVIVTMNSQKSELLPWRQCKTSRLLQATKCLLIQHWHCISEHYFFYQRWHQYVSWKPEIEQFERWHYTVRHQAADTETKHGCNTNYRYKRFPIQKMFLKMTTIWCCNKHKLANTDRFFSHPHKPQNLCTPCVLNYTVSQKKGPTLKRYSSKLYGSILMIFGGNIQKSLE